MNSESGQTTTEYGLILVIFSVAVIAILSVIAGSANELFTDSEALVKEALKKVLA